MLTLNDEFTQECLAIDASRRMTSEDVLERLSDLFIHPGPLEYTRSDNCPEFTAHRVRDWLENAGVETLFIEPGSPLGLPANGYIESFNGKLPDELFYVELFDTLLEAKVLIDRWRVHGNTELQITGSRGSSHDQSQQTDDHLTGGTIHGGMPHIWATGVIVCQVDRISLRYCRICTIAECRTR